ncbi:N-acetyltransferase family protein [Halosimplex amylolyticum]|uniref:GNAT family N-acetyltransferase n=1 Tax=Halosimplex amylolyticum TaxID=3396616 RepID=UPI003F56F088
MVQPAYRRAERGDATTIREIAEDCWQHDYPDVISRENIRAGIAEWYDTSRMRGEIESDDAVVLVAEDDAGTVCAFAHGVWDDAAGDVLRLYVAPDCRGRGIGTELLEQICVELADEAEVSTIRAMVLADNEPGNAFYRAAGFEPAGESETTIADESYDERVYERPPPEGNRR